MDSLIYEKMNSIASGFENKKDIFNILGDSTRINIIVLLLKNKNQPLSVEEITNEVHLSRPAVSHHIKALKESGILKLNKKGVFNYYSLDSKSKIWNELCILFNNVKDLISLTERNNN